MSYAFKKIYENAMIFRVIFPKGIMGKEILFTSEKS